MLHKSVAIAGPAGQNVEFLMNRPIYKTFHLNKRVANLLSTTKAKRFQLSRLPTQAELIKN